MPTQITQIDDPNGDLTILRIEGDLVEADADLIARIALETRSETGNRIKIDLADLDFRDSEAASILKRLESLDGFEFVGVEIFLQSLVNQAERRGA